MTEFDRIFSMRVEEITAEKARLWLLSLRLWMWKDTLSPEHKALFFEQQSFERYEGPKAFIPGNHERIYRPRWLCEFCHEYQEGYVLYRFLR